MILASFNYFFTSFANMEKIKISKSSPPKSLSMDHGVFKTYSILSRCNSFSSSSNDSAVYCGTHTTPTKLKNGKRLATDNQPADFPKRCRNSSGSSISSNLSSVSDKDLKSRTVHSHDVTKSPIKSNPVISPQLKYSNKSNDKELKQENIQNKNTSHSNERIIEPNQRSLRRKITKKGCACCPSAHTTVVVRRYHEIYDTEKKTVISSTKLKTYVQKGTVSTAIQAGSESNKTSTKSGASKRRKSEIEKLYESLHEIEWAKNFSPDNILRQINVRQAASCSVFGRSHTNAENLPQKNSKKVKPINSFDNTPSSSLNKSSKSENGISLPVTSNEPSANTQSCTNKFEISSLQNKKITSSNTCIYDPKFKPCNSQSSVNITVSHINVKEININSTESIHHPESLLEANGRDCDDAQLSYTSDESSSASSSIVNLQSKHLLDLDYNDRTNRDFSDADASEYSAAPTFFDIAEEGIRTIDACFREVGAEVVVSTCYDDSSLPSLTSIIENGTSSKASADDGPPVLEPCIAVTSNQNLKVDVCDDQLQIKAKRKVNKIKDDPKITCVQNSNNSNSVSFKSGQNYVVSQKFNKCYSYLIFRNNRDLLLMKARRRILKKYFKWLYSRTLIKSVPKTESNEISSTSVNILKGLNVDLKSGDKISDSKSLLNHYSIPALSSSISLVSHDISSKTTKNTTNKETVNRDPKDMYSTDNLNRKLILDYVKNGSCLYATVKALKHPNDIKALIPPEVQIDIPDPESNIPSVSTSKEKTNTPEQKSVISPPNIETNIPEQKSTTSSTMTSIQNGSPGHKSLISSPSSTTITENDSKINTEPVCRPPSSLGISCYYNSIRVIRTNNYTQIIFKLTRGRSIFFTVEALVEMRDALIRTSHDTKCQVLIINGIGNSFCLGLDIKQLIGPKKRTTTVKMAKAVKDFIETLSDFKKPVAAVINGPALGLGMTLLNHVDISIASEKATFCMPHAFLGYMPEGGATLTLPQAVGSTVAMDLLIRGKTLTAREACNVGLISEVVQAQHLPHELVSRVQMLVKSSISALETTKALLKMKHHVNLQLVLENEVNLLPVMWLNQACQDAMHKALHSGIFSK